MLPEQEAPPGKRELRARMLAARRALPPLRRAELSRLAQERLLEQPAWREALGVALYMPTQNEADTAMLLAAARRAGKEVFLPRVLRGDPGVMEFARCRSERDLVCGAYGIMEPDPRLPACVFVAPADCPPEGPAVAPDLFVIPGVAFDRAGRRLGYGGGYYDRFLSSPLLRASGRFVGLAYDFQVADELPAEPWDQPVDALCTDSGYMEFRR